MKIKGVVWVLWIPDLSLKIWVRNNSPTFAGVIESANPATYTKKSIRNEIFRPKFLQSKRHLTNSGIHELTTKIKIMKTYSYLKLVEYDLRLEISDKNRKIE